MCHHLDNSQFENHECWYSLRLAKLFYFPISGLYPTTMRVDLDSELDTRQLMLEPQSESENAAAPS